MTTDEPESYDHLNFRQLIEKADEDESVRSVIRDEYMVNKYHIHEKVIRLDHPDWLESMTSESISINNYDVARKFLQHFGDLVTKLEFNNVHQLFTKEQVETLCHDIDQHCSDTLVHIKLVGVGYHLLSETSTTFQRVTSVSLYPINIGRDSFELNRIYPMMETLELTVHYPRSLETLVRSYPNLKHLKFVEYGQRFYNNYLRNIIEMNPQLESLQVNSFPNNEFLQFVTEKATHLEGLWFTCNAFDIIRNERDSVDLKQIVHFPHVKHLTLESPYHCPKPLPLTFDHLESVTIYSIVGITNQPIQKLLENNQHIKVLSIPYVDLYPRDCERLMEFMRMLPELEEIEVQWTQKISMDNTLRWMNEIDTLKVIRFRVPIGPSGHALMAILEKKSNEWDIQDVKQTRYYHIYTVVRK